MSQAGTEAPRTATPAWEHAESVEALLTQIWESLTEDPDALAFAAAERPSATGCSTLVARVGLRGDLNGCVHVRCQEATAVHIAAQMMALDAAEDLDPADVDDALGEVANIIGGNVKSLLGGVEVLTLPQVERLDCRAATGSRDQADGPPLHTSVALWGDEQVVIEVRCSPNASSCPGDQDRPTETSTDPVDPQEKP